MLSIKNKNFFLLLIKLSYFCSENDKFSTPPSLDNFFSFLRQFYFFNFLVHFHVQKKKSLFTSMQM